MNDAKFFFSDLGIPYKYQPAMTVEVTGIEDLRTAAWLCRFQNVRCFCFPTHVLPIPDDVFAAYSQLDLFVQCKAYLAVASLHDQSYSFTE